MRAPWGAPSDQGSRTGRGWRTERGARSLVGRRAGRGWRGSQWGAGMLAAALTIGMSSGCGDDVEVVSAAITAAVAAPPVEATAQASPGVLDSDEQVLAAPELRLMLEQLLGEHVLLMSGAAADHAAGLGTEAALDVVTDNTDALTDAIELVYGEVGGRAFASLWSQHVAFFLDHARGTAHGDQHVVAEASDHLEHYEQGFGSFTATATGGALPADAVAQLLAVHVTDINGYVAARLDDDAELSAARLAAGHDYAADIGAVLAATIAEQGPVAFPGDTDDEHVEVAAELARALANHLAVRASGFEAAVARSATPSGDGARVGGGVGDAEESGTLARSGDAEESGAADGSDGPVPPSVTVAAADRLEAAVRAAAVDVPAASAALARLTTLPVGTRSDADALAAALGVPDMGEALVAVVTAQAGDPTDPELVAAHRAAYTLAATWLG